MKTKHKVYSVLVSNIGEVYAGIELKEALKAYKEYVEQSVSGYGRASFEDVTMLEDDELFYEHTNR
jgi:hypothetical protein